MSESAPENSDLPGTGGLDPARIADTRDGRHPGPAAGRIGAAMRPSGRPVGTVHTRARSDEGREELTPVSPLRPGPARVESVGPNRCTGAGRGSGTPGGRVRAEFRGVRMMTPLPVLIFRICEVS